MVYQLGEIPLGCSKATSGLRIFKSLASRSPNFVVDHLRKHPEKIEAIQNQSWDKRHTPSTFIDDKEGRYTVGWYDDSAMHVQVFTDYAEAAADYLFFSFGRGRLQTENR